MAKARINVSPQAHLDQPRRLAGRSLGRRLQRSEPASATSRASTASAKPTPTTPASRPNLRSGVHVPDSQSVTVAEAGRLVAQELRSRRARALDLDHYRQHLELHIVPLIGAVKLSRLTAPMVRAFEDKLALDRSPAMVRKVRGSLGAILADAQERGLVGQNVVRACAPADGAARKRAPTSGRRASSRSASIFPRPTKFGRSSAHLDGRWRPLLMTAIFTGLRASELRGLRWADVDFERGELHVRQRADCFNAIGRPKSEAGERTVPLLPMLVSTLRAHRLACPKGDARSRLSQRRGQCREPSEHRAARACSRQMIEAGVVDESGKAKYPGLHALRHFYASWCINRRIDGGLELPLKLVQARLGHASITMTADCYGHLFPRGDDRAELAAAEKAFLGNGVSH